MKTVMKKSEVAHAFAHQTQTEARNAGGNLYFHGDSIYSYGGHFCIAKHEEKKGQKALLFTLRGYSNTTAKHIGVVRMATNFLNVIYCHDPKATPEKNIEMFLRMVKSELHGLVNARKPEKYILPAEKLLNDAKKYADFMKCKGVKEIEKVIEKAKTGEYAIYLQKEAKRIERERVKREKAELKEFNTQVEKFKAGEVERLYKRLTDRDFLRIGKKRIETSQGIEIPFEIGKRAFAMIKDVILKGGCAGDCGFKILDYEVKSITPELMTIGCHKIDIAEIEAIAKILNW